MANWYVDNVGGNNANTGNSELLAKADIPGLAGLLTAGDIVWIKETGVDYVQPFTPTNTSTPLFTVSGGGQAIVILRRYASSTTNPKLIFRSNPAMAIGIWTTSCYKIKNIDFELDTMTSAGSSLPLTFINNTSIIENSYINYLRTGGSLVSRTFAMNFNSVSNVTVNGNNNYLILTSTTGCSHSKNTYINIQNSGTNPISLTGYISRCIFVNCMALSSGNAVITSSTNLLSFNNNTVIINDNALATGNLFIFSAVAAGSFYTTSANCFSNVFINNRTAGDTYLYAANSSVTITDASLLKWGNNAYYAMTSAFFNADPSVMSDPDTFFQFGPQIILSGSPFVSEIPGATGFAELDSSNANGLACIDKAYYDPNVDLGAKELASTGAVPNAYDLRAGVTVGAVTGTLLIPSIADVRSGTNYDVAPNAKTGILDLPSEDDVRSGTTYDNSTKTGLLDLPSEADVKLGVGYDQSSKVGLLESTDPGISNVKTGTSYKINSVTYNGTYTAYPLLALANVKFGIDRGDGQLGTDVGADFNNDPGQSNVLDGVTYKIANVNKEGTLLNYPLLPIEVVESGIDRGDGSLGTNKGEKFNSVLTPEQIAIGESIENLGETVNGTYDANERYSDLQPEVVQLGLEYIYNNDPRTGTLAGGAADYPSEDNVLFPVEYAFGAKQGKLGTYNLSILDVASQINENARLVIANVLGNEFEQLRYFKDVSKNDFNNNKGYGIRPLGDVRTFDVIGKETIDLDFEIKLATYFDNREGDEAERLAELYLIQKTEQIRRQLRVTKMGYTPQVRVVKAFDRNDVEKVDGQFVIVCRTVITVSYGIN